jgi:SAM-dependent methyltransferase
MSTQTCRFCKAPLRLSFCDLGTSPLSNAFVKPSEAHRAEAFYPLHAFVCEQCFLVQLEQFETPEQVFKDYVYFSSYSESWLEHCRRYAQTMQAALGLGPKSLVIEVASNDGYLLQYFKQGGVPVLGIEPAANVAAVAEKKGIASISEFFGAALAERLVAQGRSADLVVGNNVLAHVPDLNDFVSGLCRVLKPDGVLTLEFPHLLRLMQGNQFDTIYHEHLSYFSFTTAGRILAQHGLAVHDVEELSTHGGSLRLHASRAQTKRAAKPAVAQLMEIERRARLDDPQTYLSFSEKVKQTKRALLKFLVEAKASGKRIAGYGAPAKGNTLLNYCGIRGDFLDYTVDRSPHKQGLLLPGTRIPVFGPEKIMETRPDYVLILPWNLKDEICEQMSGIRKWGGRFVLPIPEVSVI